MRQTVLLAAASSSDAEAQERDLQLFFEQGYFEQTVRTLRTHDSPFHRIRAAETLGLAGSTAATAHLVAGLFDTSLEVRLAAAEALVKLDDPDVAVEPLKAILAQANDLAIQASVKQWEAVPGETVHARNEAPEPHAAELGLHRGGPPELHHAEAVVALRLAEAQSQSVDEGETWAKDDQATQLHGEARAFQLAEQRDGEDVALFPTVRETADLAPGILEDLHSDDPEARAQALTQLAGSGSKAAFRLISQAFDDAAPEVHSAAARGLCELEPGQRAEFFDRAIQEGSFERSLSIGAALVSSGLANEAIEDLGGDRREVIYDALCLLLTLARTGEIATLIRAIEEHPNVVVRRAAIKLVILGGHARSAEAAVKRRLMLQPNLNRSPRRRT